MTTATAPPVPTKATTTGATPKVLEDLSEGERYLWAILQDPSGLDQAEFLWFDPAAADGCFRAWPFQWSWWRCIEEHQIDQCARSIGKSLSIKVRGFAFALLHPGQEMVISAPELVHLEPIVGLIENQVYNTRLTRELLMKGRSAVTHRPFQMNFLNGARIMGRIPQRDGKGMKGIHPIWLEIDEAQDFPHAGWVETTETLKQGFDGAACVWRCHGVTRGVQDDFWKNTQDRPDNHWKVHRFPAMYRPTWTDKERIDKVKQYGSADDPDYRRNVLGLHGDSTSPLFVAHRLFRCVDDDLTSDYNVDEYFNVGIKTETLSLMKREIIEELDFPARHLKYLGPEQRRNPRAVFWVGMDVGFTVDPSEILVFVEYREKPTDPFSKLRLLTRISMTRVGHSDQVRAILHTINFYKPKVFAMDKGGLGLPLLQEIQEYAETSDPDRIPAYLHEYDLKGSLAKIKGYNFSEKIIVDFDDTIEIPDDDDQALKDAMLKRNTKEYSSDKLRALVDSQRIELPWDDVLLKQFQGGTVSSVGGMDQYGHKRYNKGDDHTLDAARFMALGWAQFHIEELLAKKHENPPIFVQFMQI